MIQVQSLLNISDNSGCKLGCCIKLVHGYKNRWCSCGDLILVSIKKLKKGRILKNKIQKGEMIKAVILRTKSKFRRKNNNFIQFKENSIGLVNKQLRPIGTRVIGPVLRELRKSKYMKLASISEGFV
jgi:large subunit ribosomal protein L14